MDFFEDYWWLLIILCFFIHSIYDKVSDISSKLPGDNKPEAEKTPNLPGLLPDGSWKCEYCGTLHSASDSVCVCGASRPKAAAHKASESKAAPDIVDAAEEIRKYKQLLDEGILTQEEFDAKKKQLLDL